MIIRNNSKYSNKNSKRPRGAVFKVVEQEKEVSFKDRFMEQFLIIKTRFQRGENKKYGLVVNVFLVTLLISAGFGLNHYLKNNMFIGKVVVKGDFVQIDRKEVEQHLASMLGSNYFNIDIRQIQSALTEFTWLESADVRRVWPDTLLVDIKEHEVIATWGEDSFVNDKGEIFSPAKADRDYLKNIPDLNGNKRQSEMILKTYVMLSHKSKQEKLKINHFSLMSNSYWVLGFQNGIELLIATGREEESLARFLKFYRKEGLFNSDKKMRIDMRYTNGFALLLTNVKNNLNVHSKLRSGNNHG